MDSITEGEQKVINAILAGQNDVDCWVWGARKEDGWRTSVFAYGNCERGRIFCTRPNNSWYLHAEPYKSAEAPVDVPSGQHGRNTAVPHPVPHSIMKLCLRHALRRLIASSTAKPVRSDLQGYAWRASGMTFDDVWYDSWASNVYR